MTTFTSERAAAIREALIVEVATHRTTRVRRYLASGALVLVGATAGAGISAAAFATSSDTTPSSDTTSTTRTFTTAEGQTYGLLSEQPGFLSGGMGSEPGLVVVTWDGKPGLEAQAIIDEATTQGVTIQVILAGHTPQDIDEATKTLVGALMQAGIAVSGFGQDRHYTAIEIMGPELSEDPALQAQARQIATDTIGDTYTIHFLPNEESINYPFLPDEPTN